MAFAFGVGGSKDTRCPVSEPPFRRHVRRDNRYELLLVEEIPWLPASRAFLASRHGDKLTDAQIRKAEAITRDMDGLEESLVCQIKIDPVLSKITTAEDLVIEFRQAVDAQFHRRKMKFPQQSVPISIPMTREIIDLRRLLHGDETVKPRKNQSPRRVIRSETNRPDRERAIQQPDWFDR